MNENTANVAPRSESYFDGGLFQYLGWWFLGFLVTIFTLGICFPWACCMLYRWEIKHTVINGHRLAFDGTALQLFGNWIKWWLLTIITLGIYGFWLNIKLKKWITKHTKFEIDVPYAPNAQTNFIAPQPIPIAPAPEQQKPFTLKSKDLVTANGMWAYCQHFGFTGGASEAVCKDLLKKAEGSIAPDNEVVMTFIAVYDDKHENERPEMCACVFGATRFIIANQLEVQTIPILKIERFSMERGRAKNKLVLETSEEKVPFWVDSNRTEDLLNCCQRSLLACKAEIKEEKAVAVK